MSYKSPRRDKNILDSDIMVHTAKHDRDGTGNGYASLFYCGIYPTLWDILLTLQIFQLLLITDNFKVVSVGSRPARGRFSRALCVICIAGIFWMRPPQKWGLAFSPVLKVASTARVPLLSVMKYLIQDLQFMSTNCLCRSVWYFLAGQAKVCV